MVRIILGVIVGFLAWSILWVGGEQVLTSMSPDWYGKHQEATTLALANGSTFTADTTIAFISLIRSIIASVLSGFLAAIVASESRKSTMVLGIILFAVGLLVEILFWNVLPVWYHIIFLVLLIPMTILGGKLKRTA